MNDVAHHRWDEGKAVPIECFRSVALATEFHFKPTNPQSNVRVNAIIHFLG